jgi:hypothetical protein
VISCSRRRRFLRGSSASKAVSGSEGRARLRDDEGGERRGSRGSGKLSCGAASAEKVNIAGEAWRSAMRCFVVLKSIVRLLIGESSVFSARDIGAMSDVRAFVVFGDSEAE